MLRCDHSENAGWIWYHPQMACANCARQMIGCTAFQKLSHFAMWKMVKSLISLTCKQKEEVTPCLLQEAQIRSLQTIKQIPYLWQTKPCPADHARIVNTWECYPPPSTPLSQLQADQVILMQFANHWLPTLDTESFELKQQWVNIVIIMWLVPPHPNSFFLEEVQKT